MIMICDVTEESIPRDAVRMRFHDEATRNSAMTWPQSHKILTLSAAACNKEMNIDCKRVIGREIIRKSERVLR